MATETKINTGNPEAISYATEELGYRIPRQFLAYLRQVQGNDLIISPPAFGGLNHKS